MHNKILVIRGGAIGDFILTLPVWRALRAQFPRTQLEVLGYPHIAQVALAGGLVDVVRSIEAGALAGFFAEGGRLDASLRSYFADFAIIISYLYDPDLIFQNNVNGCTKAQFIVGPHRPPESGPHATAILLKPLERLAIFDADPVPRLHLPGSTPARPMANGCPRLALHPGSGGEHKNWPEAHWRELLESLAETEPLNFLLVGGEAEGAKLDRLAKVLPPGRLEVARHLPLAELAVKLQSCRLFLGHDSGISHLAAALGRPTVVLWGPTVEAVWRPLGEGVTILRAPDGLENLAVTTVRQQVQELI